MIGGAMEKNARAARKAPKGTHRTNGAHVKAGSVWTAPHAGGEDPGGGPPRSPGLNAISRRAAGICHAHSAGYSEASKRHDN